MPTHLRAYHRPSNLAETLALIQPRAEVVAVAQLGPRVPVGLYPRAEALVDLRALGLDRLAETETELHLGAQATLQALIDFPPLRALAGGLLPRAARLAAHPGLRNLATLAGALASPDGPPEVRLALLALGASVVVQGAERRRVPLADCRPAPGELWLELIVPKTPPPRGGLSRVARTPQDQAIVAAVAAAAGDTLRVAVAGASPEPLLMTVAGPLDEARLEATARALMAAAQPGDDYRASADYRRAMTGVLARRAMEAVR